MGTRPKVAIAAAVLLAVGMATQLIGAGTTGADTQFGSPHAAPLSGETTDVIRIGLLMAQSRGLDHSPDAMYIASGEYRNFKPSPVRVPITDSRRVWVMWIRAHYILSVGLGGNLAMEHTICYIDAVTGQPMNCMAGPTTRFGPLPGDDYSQRGWTRVTEHDIGKYPIRVWKGEGLIIPVHRTSTPTPTMVGTPVPTSTPHP